MSLSVDQFRFVDPGLLADRELELVSPDERWIDGMLQATGHPLTRKLAPEEARLTREQFVRFVRDYPMGRQRPNPAKGTPPAYTFWMRLQPRDGQVPLVPMAGGITLRIGHTENLERYVGHIGYGVYPPARGNHLAERAVRLLFPLCRQYGLSPLWITCNPDNHPSRRTCERLGGQLIDIVDLPGDHPLYLRGEKRKCRYLIPL